MLNIVLEMPRLLFAKLGGIVRHGYPVFVVQDVPDYHIHSISRYGLLNPFFEPGLVSLKLKRYAKMVLTDHLS